MARKKKEIEVRIDDDIEQYIEDTLEANDGSLDGAFTSDELRKNAVMYILPMERQMLSQLLAREAEGEIMITDKQMFPSKDSLTVAVYVEYEVYNYMK